MWDWINCYLSGRHDYGRWCENGTIYLRCIHCGRRSCGWNIGDAPAAASRSTHIEPATATATGASLKRATVG
jgi:hypothetical protein